MKKNQLFRVFVTSLLVMSVPIRIVAEESAIAYTNIEDLMDSDRKLLQERFLDESGTLVNNEKGYALERDDYNEEGYISERSYFDSEENPVIPSDKEYAQITYEYDDQGLVSYERYYGTDGDRITLTNGYSGYHVVYRDKDHKLEESWLNDADDLTKATNLGYAHIIREFDEVGNTIRESYYDEKDEPQELASGQASVTREFNDQNQKIKECYFDADGEQVLLSDKGCAQVTYEYDDQGLVSYERYYGTDGERITLANGYSGYHAVYRDKDHKLEESWLNDADELTKAANLGYAHVVREFDEAGNCTRESYYDEKDEPQKLANGQASLTREYNEYNQKIKESYFDKDGNPVALLNTGYAQVSYEYDDQGLVSYERYYGTDGKRITLANGYSGYHAVYRDKDRKLEESWLNDSDELAIAANIGCAHIVREFDEAGNCTRESYYDEKDAPQELANGQASVTREFNDRNQKIKECYFDAEGDPVVLSDRGYAQITYEYDDQGLVNCERYFDEEGERITLENGISGYRVVYQDKDHKLEESWLDEEDHLTFADNLGYAHVIRAFDEAGNTIREAYFDDQDQPMMLETGYAIMTREYNDLKQKTRESYFDTDEHPVMNAGKGYAQISYEYDEAGNVISERYFDVDGNRRDLGGYSGYQAVFNADKKKVEEAYLDDADKLSVNEQLAYAMVRHDYDTAGFEIATRYYDAEENPVEVGGAAVILRTYDELGNVTTEKRYDAQDEIVLNEKGYAYLEREFNDQKKVTLETFCDADGDPMQIGEYASISRSYDEAGNVILESYYGADGEDIILAKGYAAIRREYTPENKVSRIEYLDLSGNPIMITDGFAAITYDYDDSGNVILDKWFNENGDQILQKDKDYASVLKEYNDSGKVIRSTYVDFNNDPVTLQDGYCTIVNEYDSAGNVIYEAYYNADGDMVIPESKGYAAIRREYDANKKQTSEVYLGLDGQPVPLKTGYAKKTMEYDDAGRLCRQSFLDTQDNPVMSTDEYASFTKEYDEDGTVRTTFFDASLQRTKAKAGYAILEQYYNENGAQTGEAYFDVDGNPAPLTDDAYVRFELLTREDGSVLKNYYDAAGNVVKTEG